MNMGKIKVLLLLAMAFVLGGGTLVTMYATGQAVVENGDVMYMVSHTEYRYNEPGQIVTRLVDFQDNPVAITNCTATILYPNKTIYLGPALMNDTGTISGDHYYEFTTPNGPEGIYEYQALCYYAAGLKSKSATNSFHLSSALTTLQESVDNLNNTVLSINTSLSNELGSVNLSISNSVNDFRQEVQANFSTVLDELLSINSTVNDIDFTPVISRLDYMNATQQQMVSILLNINSTTTSTYAYLTGTMATNINNVLTQLGVINATVNRIEANTLEINSTTSQILQNQQDEVYMNVYSG
jgi:hypothetical protein